VKRGEIYWADLEPRSGSEQRGRRPVIILSNDGFNEAPNWKSIIVVPCSTSNVQKRRGPTVVILPQGIGGLKQDCAAVCHQITTVDRSKLIQRLGALSDVMLRDVEAAIRAAVDLEA
jgi:mRNA interferase MazF